MALTFAKYIEDRAFVIPSVIEMYSIVEDARRTLGFSRPESNEIIMSQAEYVSQQYRKFVNGIKEEILTEAERNEPEALYQTIWEQKEQLDSYPTSERLALYYTVRDVWLNQLLQGIQYWIMTDGQVEGELNG